MCRTTVAFTAVLVTLLGTVACREGELETPKGGNYSINGWRSPLDGHITNDANFGDCGEEEGYFDDLRHNGADYGSAYGGAENSPVYSIGEGEVVEYSSGDDGGWGADNVGLLIMHQSTAGRFVAIYGHIKESGVVGRGDTVSRGKVLGKVGDWPWGDHLHFGIYPGADYPKKRWGRVPDEGCDAPEDLNGFVPPYTYLVTNSPGNFSGCACPDMSGVGVLENGENDQVLSEAFVDAYWRANPRIGCPFDAGGGQFVHDVRGVWLQDFRQDQPDCPLDGSDGESALIYQPNGHVAYRIKEGFWGVYKCVIVEGEPNGGAVLLGAPINEEYEHPITHQITQDFSNGYLWWDDDDDSIHVHLNEYTPIDYDEVSACSDTVVVENEPGPDSLVVTYPNGGEAFALGETITLTWVSSDTSGYVDVRFHQGPNLDPSDSPPIATVGAALQDNGYYEGMTFYGDVFTPGDSDYFLCISDVDGSPWDCSDGHFSITEETGYPDDDGDGYTADTDCDDTDPSVYPGAIEACNGEDDDCDGGVPADEIDDDGDGQKVCDGDCDDTDPHVGDGFVELCDGLDNDCDGLVAGEEDLDGDGYAVCASDCDDSDPAVYPGAAESCDGVDNDCNGAPLADEVDDDGDGQMVCGGDCDDTNANTGLGFPELCDGEDNDCNGQANDESDSDGDGYYPCGGDCDENESTVFPGAPELCDGLDNDCDGAIPNDEQDSDLDSWMLCELDCNDFDGSVYPGAPEQCDGVDNDCDGSVDEDTGLDQDGDGYNPCVGDCNDNEPLVYPGATELCDGMDNNCDGDLLSGEVDADADGYLECEECDDGDPNVYPGAPDYCDGVFDNNCDGLIDPWEMDDDGDGDTECSGDCNDTDLNLNLHDMDGDGYHTCGGDCDDLDSDIHPGVIEQCNAVDDDCDGVVPNDEQDWDGDSWFACEDCNDSDPAVHPGATETCNGLDDDCDGLLPGPEHDLDGDGYIACLECDDDDSLLNLDDLDADSYSTCDGDCNDNDVMFHPNAIEMCDGLDTDCDGVLPIEEEDADADGMMACEGDCDDTNDNTYLGAVEICDGQDNNCNGAVGATEYDDDLDGQMVCDGDCDDSAPSVYPGAPDICDLFLDNDCDGLTDLLEADDDGDGASECEQDCDDNDANQNIEDVDGDGLSTCDGDCDDENAEIFLGADEIPYDGIDQDCDGNDLLDVDGDGYDAEVVGGDDCDDNDQDANPGMAETEDGIDNDCDGLVDNTQSWHYEIVDSSGEVGRDAAITLDQSDLAHIAYAAEDDELRYARDTGMGWLIETVDVVAHWVWDIDIALETSETPHITYSEYTDDEIRHAWWDGSWQRETIDYEAIVGTQGGDTSILIDENDNIHVAFADNDDDYASYMYYDGTWTEEYVESVDCRFTSLALDEYGTPWVSYHDAGTDLLRLAYRTGNNWILSTIDSDDHPGHFSKIAVGSDGHPRIVYAANEEDTVRFARWNGAAWEIHNIVADVLYQDLSDIDMVLDSYDQAHICYVWDGSSWGEVYYAVGTDDTWEHEIIYDMSDSLSGQCGIVLDSYEYPHVAFFDNDDEDLIYSHYW